MELNFNYLPSDMIHVSASDGQNAGVMELNAVIQADLSECSTGYADDAPLS